MRRSDGWASRRKPTSGGAAARPPNGLSGLAQVAKDSLEDAAVAVVADLVRGVEPRPRLELHGLAAFPCRLYAHVARPRDVGGHRVGEALEIKDLLAGEAQRIEALAIGQLERDHAH